MDIRVAICDDEIFQIEYLKAIVVAWASAASQNVTIAAFTNTEAFIFANEDQSFDILLLDIQMGDVDGITLAKRLRELGIRSQIIFITGFTDYMSEGYEVSALNYLLKPVSREKLCEVLDKAREKLDKPEEFIIVSNADGQAKLLLRDIIYAEAFAHTVVLYTAKCGFEVKLSIGKLEEMLGKRFCRCHRSYIVGLRHIYRITKSEVIMEGGSAVPLSRRLYVSVNKAFISFYTGEGA